MSKPIIRDKLYIPKSMVSLSSLRENYEHNMYDDSKCQPCEFLPERHCDICDDCPNFKGIVSLWKRAVIDDEPYYAIPSGYIKRAEEVLEIDLKEVIDERKEYKKSEKLKFTGKLFEGQTINGVKRPNQKALADAWLKKKMGIIEAPPRTGKTVLGVYLTCKLKVKTVIVAHEIRLLEQFYETFQTMTNVQELRDRTGNQIVGLVKDIRQMSNLDVALVTYQKFIRDHEKIEKYLNPNFSFIIIDEVHQGNADAYSRFINSTWAKYKLGLSATLRRKDHRQFIMRDIVGPIVARSKRRALLPDIQIIETEVKPDNGYDYRTWMGALNWLCLNKKRQELIVDEVFKDLKDGHSVIIIPCTLIEHIKDTVKRINQKAIREGYNKNLAIEYHGEESNEKSRDKIFKRVESGNPTVLVAQIRMIRQGVNMEKPTMLYSVVPTSGEKTEGAPMFEQLATRVCTPAEGKKKPVVKIFVDAVGISVGCFKSLFMTEIKPFLYGDHQVYKMSPQNKKRAFEIISDNNYSGKNKVKIKGF